jgi:hypothetical protein
MPACNAAQGIHPSLNNSLLLVLRYHVEAKARLLAMSYCHTNNAQLLRAELGWVALPHKQCAATTCIRKTAAQLPSDDGSCRGVQATYSRAGAQTLTDCCVQGHSTACEDADAALTSPQAERTSLLLTLCCASCSASCCRAAASCQHGYCSQRPTGCTLNVLQLYAPAKLLPCCSCCCCC